MISSSIFDDPFFKDFYKEEDIMLFKNTSIIQELLNDMAIKSTDEIAQTLLHSCYSQSYEGVRQILDMIFQYFRASSCTQIRDIIIALISLQGPGNCFSQIKDLLLKHAFDPDYFHENIVTRLTYLFFFTHYWSQFDITEQEIVNGIEFTYYQSPFAEIALSYFYIMFGDILQRLHPTLYTLIRSKHYSNIKQKRSISDPFLNCVCFSEEIWLNFEKSVAENTFPSILDEIVRTDNIEEFKEISKFPTFNINIGFLWE